MARGRMINTTIATDKRLADLPLEAELFFLKTIPHLDRDGLILGDASLLWARVCPRRPELLNQVADYVELWIASGLVQAYDTPDGIALFFLKFTKNQAGLRYDREPASTIQCPPGYTRTITGLVQDRLLPVSGNPPAILRQSSGSLPAEEKLREVKLKEEKLKEVKRSKSELKVKPASLPPQAQVFIDNGGKWPTGKLTDGTSKRDRAIQWICERVTDDMSSLVLFGKVVAGYCAQWSPKSYTVMVNDYYLAGRVPGEPTQKGKGNGSGNYGISAFGGVINPANAPPTSEQIAEVQRARAETAARLAAAGRADLSEVQGNAVAGA